VHAVREVLADVGADKVTELLVVNKIDAADEETLLRLKRLWPGAIFVSARTGAGMADVRAAIEQRLPWPAVEVYACVPYDRGDLVARVHSTGEVLATEHTGEGTTLHVRVDPALAADLAPYAMSSRPTADHAA
jgi:GTP-binding protein HflX